MIDEAAGYRSKEQVLLDLCKAFPFSAEALQANRQGKLAKEQFSKYISQCSRPATMAVACFLAPLLFWTGITAGKEHVSFVAAFPIFLSNLVRVGELTDPQEKLTAFAALATTVVFLGLAVFLVSRISMPLYLDLLDRKVVVKEGRLVAREHQTMRDDGRDPVEKYYFALKDQRYEVNQASFRALESGAAYVLYFLPRSDVLVALEPKLDR
jgi:hypothetical protein